MRNHKEAATAIALAGIGITILACVSPYVWPVLLGAAIGAGLKGTSEIFSQKVVNKQENLDWDKIVTATASGSLSGAFMGSSAGKVVSMIGNSIINAGNTALNEFIDIDKGEEVKLSDFAIDIGISATMGLIAGKVGGAGVQNDIYSVSTSIGASIYTGMADVHYEVLGTYKTAIEVAAKELGKGVVKTLGTAIVSGGVNTLKEMIID